MEIAEKGAQELPGRDRAKQRALLRYHYQIDPAGLSDEAFDQLWEEYLYVRHQDREMLVSVMRQVVAEAFGKQK